jgi:hypothetical protein
MGLHVFNLLTFTDIGGLLHPGTQLLGFPLTHQVQKGLQEGMDDAHFF